MLRRGGRGARPAAPLREPALLPVAQRAPARRRPPPRERLPLRARLGDPCDLARRPVLPAISTLTLRRDRAPGGARFVLHWRDPAKVASGGGLYQVMPVGMFQPSADAAWNEANDFDLWRCMAREFSEEFLGCPERYGSDTAPIRYDRWPFFRRLSAARRSGHLSVYLLGLGVDPLTLVMDVLVAAVFDAGVFDELLGDVTAANAEGRVVGAAGRTDRAGIPFTAESVDRFARRAPMQPAGAAVLRLAWRHRAVILAGG